MAADNVQRVPNVHNAAGSAQTPAQSDPVVTG